MLRTFTPEHIEMLGMFDSRAQQRAHRLLVVLLAILGIAALLTRRRRVKLTVPSAVVSCIHLVRENAGIGVLAGVAVCFMLYRGTQPATSYAIVQGAYYPLALLPSALSQLLAMAGGTLAMMAYCWAMRQPGDRRAGGSAETREHARARGLRVHPVRDDIRHTAGSARIYAPMACRRWSGTTAATWARATSWRRECRSAAFPSTRVCSPPCCLQAASGSWDSSASAPISGSYRRCRCCFSV